ncbi:hypothetical protein [Mycolicibacterium septicum]|uniref:hypothetical protein n=1 Tax=Mycolicibacterium septicum TaxID=98668 RepID=UPI003B58D450
MVVAVSAVTVVLLVPRASADPPAPCIFQCLRPDNEMIQPFPVIVPTASDWVPKFPFPFDQTRNRVTEADITALREMCQWYNAQYDQLIDQIDRVQFNRIQQNGPGVRVGSGTDWDYSVDGIQQQVDIVTANIDQAVAFLTPRALALTIDQDRANDNFFPLYGAEGFYRLWQQLSNVNNGIKAHQPDWFTGPSLRDAKSWGSKVNRSHVCD